MKKAELEMLLWHYGNLYESTSDLAAYCAQRGITLEAGFTDVVYAIADLKKRIETAED